LNVADVEIHRRDAEVTQSIILCAPSALSLWSLR